MPGFHSRWFDVRRYRTCPEIRLTDVNLARRIHHGKAIFGC
jgi:hypothetical protein